MIESEVKEALNSLGVPVTFNKYTGTETTYITFLEYNNQSEDSSEDEIDSESHFIQVNIFSKNNYIELVKKVKSAMKIAGFFYTNGNDQYESDTGLHHKSLRFFKAEYLK